jgi:hypothetical protein
MFRTTAWIGAVVIWIVWQRPPSPAKWLGLLPVRPRAMAPGARASRVELAAGHNTGGRGRRDDSSQRMRRRRGA